MSSLICKVSCNILVPDVYQQMRNIRGNINPNHLHLCVIVDIDHIHRSVSVTDVEDTVIIRLQHLQKINICPTIDEDKILKLQKKKRRQKLSTTDKVAKINITACFHYTFLPVLCVLERQCRGPAILLPVQVCTGPGHSETTPEDQKKEIKCHLH